jgi:cobalamin biosynthesis protein CobD/CbiB
LTTPCSKITTAAPEAITGLLLVLLLVLSLLVQVLLVLHLLVRFLLVLHLLVRILLVLATPAGIELSNNLSRSRTQQESNSASAARPCKLTNVRCTTTVAHRPNDPPYDL